MEPGSESGPRSVPKGRHLKAADICFSATGQGLGKPVRGSPPKGGLERTELGIVVSPLECSKNKGPHWAFCCGCCCVSYRCPGWEINHPCLPPTPDSSVLRSSGAHGTITLFPPEPGVCRAAGILCPPRAQSPRAAAFASVASRRRALLLISAQRI